MLKKPSPFAYETHYSLICCLYTLAYLDTTININNHHQDDFDSFILNYISNFKYRRELRKFAETIFHSIEKYSKYLESNLESKTKILFFSTKSNNCYNIDVNIEKYLARFRTVYFSEKFLVHSKRSNRLELNLSYNDINILAVETLTLFLKR